jgi:hypothetical protein
MLHAALELPDELTQLHFEFMEMVDETELVSIVRRQLI